MLNYSNTYRITIKSKKTNLALPEAIFLSQEITALKLIPGVTITTPVYWVRNV